MLLPHKHALRFITAYQSALLHVIKNTNIRSNESIYSDLATARALIAEDRNLLEVALTDLASKGAPVEPEVAAAMRSIKVEKWFCLKHTKKFTVFLDQKTEGAYAVRALTTPLNEMLDDPPFLIETGVFEFQGWFVCDGLVLNPVMLGRGYHSELKAVYSQLRKSGNFHARAPAQPLG